MNESRRAKRRDVNQAIEVIDTMTESSLGRVGNISQTGMMVIGQVLVPEDALFQIRLGLIEDNGRQRDLDAGIQHLWTDEGSAPGQVWLGFRFIDISGPDADFLRLWVEHQDRNRH